MKWFAAVMLPVGLAAAVSCGRSASTREAITEVKVKQGLVQGTLDRGVGTFYAIPYAEAPVGDLRWKAPVPRRAWEGVYDATVAGARPPQPMRSGDGEDRLMTEDCLFVNVQTPATSRREKLPVLVWIHGGAFATGSAGVDGIHFAEQGIVFVALGYRLGALGFLALPELSSENERGVSGNYGLLDMIEGLKWVKENISAFGGDPSKVTIMGESAGAIAVSMLCASPLAKGLFRGAISESGGSFCPVDSVRTNQNGLRDLARSEQFGKAFMERIGASSLEELRAMDWHPFVNDPVANTVSGFWPTVDGYVLPDDQYRMYEAGNYNDVNVLIGTNSDEGVGFLPMTTLSQFREDVRKEYGTLADRALELYPAATDNQAYNAVSDMFRENAFAWHTWAWANLQRKTGKGKVWLYYFDQYDPEHPVAAGPDGPFSHGALHASELPYVFKLPVTGLFEGGDKTVSEAMNAYWCSFVKTGDPNGKGLASWPVYEDGTASVLYFKDGTSLIETPNKPQLELADEYFARRRALSGR